MNIDSHSIKLNFEKDELNFLIIIRKFDKKGKDKIIRTAWKIEKIGQWQTWTILLPTDLATP